MNECKVCTSPYSKNTSTSSISICRACDMFFRRAKGRKFVCRAGTDFCAVERESGLMCKKCRYAKLLFLYTSSGSVTMNETPTQLDPSTSSNDDKACWICHSPNEEHRLGINLCRACYMFYRRTDGKPSKYECKFGKNSCSPAEDHHWVCKKCRFDCITTRLRTANPTTSCVNSEDSCAQSHPSSSYREMCHFRFQLESKGTANSEFQLVKLEELAAIARISMEAFQTFATSAFPVFETLSSTDQWALLQNFFKPFRQFEEGFRTLKYFGLSKRWQCFGYTKYLDRDSLKYSISETTKKKNYLAIVRVKDNDPEYHCLLDWLPIMDKDKLRDEEFLAGIGLLLWNVEGKLVSDDIASLASQQRNAILTELHDFYRKCLGVMDYATRIGELFLLISTIERSIRSKYHILELCKLLDVFDDETMNLTKIGIE